MESDVTEGLIPTQGPESWPLENAASQQGGPAAAAAYAAPAASATAQLPVDAIVYPMAQLVFVTTGQAACEEFDEFPVQMALTPVVARRVAGALRSTLEYSDLPTREAIVAQWQAEEDSYVPHGRLLLDANAVRLGIEPLGAGALITVNWAFVPALILQLEAAAARVG